MYLPTYGRFGQVDPAYDQARGNADSWNLYGYALNNPVTKSDPDGMRSVAGQQATHGVHFKTMFSMGGNDDFDDGGTGGKAGDNDSLLGNSGHNDEGQGPTDGTSTEEEAAADATTTQPPKETAGEEAASANASGEAATGASAVQDKPAATATEAQTQTMDVFYDKKYAKYDVDGNRQDPKFVTEQAANATTVAGADGVKLQINIIPLDNLEKGVSQASSSSERAAAGLAMEARVSAIGAKDRANIVGVLLSQPAYEALGAGDHGMTRRPGNGSANSFIYAGTNNRALAHEMYHHLGRYNGSLHNGKAAQFFGINEYHNRVLNREMDKLGISSERYIRTNEY
jgi:hypothetical protein